MLADVIPQLLKDGDRKSRYIQDPLRAAAVMVYVWRQYRIRLENSELHQLCTALCLPKLEKDNFLQYWAEFSRDVSILRYLPNLFNNLGIIPSANLKVLTLLPPFTLIFCSCVQIIFS